MSCNRSNLPTGDIVGVFSGAKALADRPVSGVVTRCSETTVSVAFDSFPPSDSLSSHDGSLVLIKLANDITYSRIKRFGTVCMYLDVICYTLHGTQASTRHSEFQGFLSQEDCSGQTCPNACLHVAVIGNTLEFY